MMKSYKLQCFLLSSFAHLGHLLIVTDVFSTAFSLLLCQVLL